MRASQAAGEAEEASSHSSSLNNRLERLQGEVARASRAEKEVKERLETTQRQLREERELRGGKGEEVEGLRRRVGELEQERRLLEDRLAHSKAVAGEARQEVREEVERREEAVRRLQEAERQRQEAEQRLAQAGANTGADNYLKEELNKARKEVIALQEKVEESERKVKVLRVERREEVRESRDFKELTSRESERVVRTQMIPQLSGRSPGQDCGEHQVRIRLLEQEVERHLRRIHCLEQQLGEVEGRARERAEGMARYQNSCNVLNSCKLYNNFSASGRQRERGSTAGMRPA